MLASTIGQIFKPLYELLAGIIAFFYALIPNFAVAIALLTVVVMIVTAPLTVKSTRSTIKMQRVAPELKKIQAKYKGDRVTLNEEMMKLYKEHGINPAGGCLPMLIQLPVFVVLYGVIRGLTSTVREHGNLVARPDYVSHSTRLVPRPPHRQRPHEGLRPGPGQQPVLPPLLVGGRRPLRRHRGGGHRPAIPANAAAQ